MTLRTVVVIEDDPILRLDMVETLKAAGLDVADFEDGDHALDYIRHHREAVGCVFTDVHLATDTNGLEVAHLVTETFPGIVVIVTSGAFAERPPGLADSVRFLPKPWNTLDVINAMVDTAQND